MMLKIFTSLLYGRISVKHVAMGMFVFFVSVQSLLAQPQSDIYAIPLDSLWNMKVSGVSRFEQPADKTPGSLIVITEQQIETRGYQDLSDVLKDIPGFDISDNAARFGEYLTLRGIQGSERILVLVDGHKINSPTGTLLSVGNSISVRFVKQIEIIYGPASAMYGSDAYSGIINIISKDSYRNKVNVASGVSYGAPNSVDARLETRVKVNDNLSFTFFGRMFRSDGFDVVGTDTVFNIINRYQPPLEPKCDQPIRDYTFFVRADYKKFTFGYFRQMFDEGNARIESPLKNVYSSMNKWKFNTDNAWITYSKETGRLGTLTSDVNVASFKLNNNSQFTKWVTANQPSEYLSQYMYGSDVAVKGTSNLHKIFSGQFELIAGVDFEYITSIPFYASDQVFGKSYKYEGAVADSINKVMKLKEYRLSGFGQLIWSPVKKLDLIFGGRFDYSSRYKQTFNPRIGVVFNPFTKTLIKFLYGTAFQDPSLFFQYEQFGTSTHVMLSESEVRAQVDPSWELNNQLVSTYELSFTQQLAKSIHFKTSVYYNYLTDIIERVTFDPSGNTYNKYFDKLSIGVRNENIGIQKIMGLNTELTYGISGKLESYFYYCYTKGLAETETGDKDIPRISENKIWLGATYSGLLGFINISPRFRWIGRINNMNAFEFPDGYSKGYTSVDLNVSANRIFGFMKVYAQVTNLMNQNIYHAGLFQQTGGHLATIPQEGIGFKMGIEVNFVK